VLGQHLLLHRLINKDVPLATQLHVVWCSAIDGNNFVDLECPALAPAPVVKPEDGENNIDFDFGSSDEDGSGDDADSLNFSAFNRRR
jgi:hypothetical protein